MAVPIFPISFLIFPFKHDLKIDSVIHDFGGGYEQRQVFDLPRGPRSDGEGNQTTYLGVNLFRLPFKNLKFASNPVTGNANLNNSIRTLWKFYKERFHDPATGQVKFEAFYIYNIDENDDDSTWTGDTVTNGQNSRGEAVDNTTGRYLVRFSQPLLSYTRFKTCLYSGILDVVEVVA